MRFWEHGRNRESGQSRAGAQIRDQIGRTELVDFEAGERVGDMHIESAAPIVNGRRRLRLGEPIQQRAERPCCVFRQVIPAKQRNDRVRTGLRHRETVSRETLDRHALGALRRTAACSIATPKTVSRETVAAFDLRDAS